MPFYIALCSAVQVLCQEPRSSAADAAVNLVQSRQPSANKVKTTQGSDIETFLFFLVAKNHLDSVSIIKGPYKIINLNEPAVDLLNFESCLYLPWQKN